MALTRDLGADGEAYESPEEGEDPDGGGKGRRSRGGDEKDTRGQERGAPAPGIAEVAAKEVADEDTDKDDAGKVALLDLAQPPLLR